MVSKLTYLRDRNSLAVCAPSCLFEKLWDLCGLSTSLRTITGQHCFFNSRNRFLKSQDQKDPFVPCHVTQVLVPKKRKVQDVQTCLTDDYGHWKCFNEI